jgi:hypothetical protein
MRMRNFSLGVVVGLLLAVVGASAHWAVSVETTYRRNTKEGLGPHAPYCMVVEAEDSSRAEAVAPALCWRTG